MIAYEDITGQTSNGTGTVWEMGNGWEAICCQDPNEKCDLRDRELSGCWYF
jgi:hypothetical protein